MQAIAKVTQGPVEQQSNCGPFLSVYDIIQKDAQSFCTFASKELRVGKSLKHIMRFTVSGNESAYRLGRPY